MNDDDNMYEANAYDEIVRENMEAVERANEVDPSHYE